LRPCCNSRDTRNYLTTPPKATTGHCFSPPRHLINLAATPINLAAGPINLATRPNLLDLRRQRAVSRALRD
jgi:hypothetical protein